MPDFIFVYGTLRRGCTTGAHARYLAGAEFIDTAKVKGKLYRVSYYPALVLDESAGWVTGEVYRLTSAAQLAQLDAYEDCTFPAMPNQEYQRKEITARTQSGIEMAAWVYVYQRVDVELELITSGDFLNS